MKPALSIALAAVVLAILGPLLYLYSRYRSSPAALWKSRLFRLRDELYARRRVLLAAPSDSATELRRLRDQYFRQYTSGISVGFLEQYPGIGPVTVDKLRQVGLKSVADLPGFVFESIQGIGPVKASELRAALAKALDHARGQFDAGGCPEGQAYRTAEAQRQAEAQRLAQANIREAQAIDATLAEIDRLATQSLGVSFWNFVLKTPHGVTTEIMARPLPAVSVAAAPVVVPTVPVPPPTPQPRSAPVIAKNGPSAVVLPPRQLERKAPEPKDLFEDMLAKTTATAKTDSKSGEPAGLKALRATARFGFMVAKADGRIAQAERKAVRGYLEQKFGGDPLLVRFLDVTMEEVEKAIPSEADAVAGVLAAVPEAERADLCAWAERITDASGERNAKEAELLARVRTALGVSRDTTGSAPAVSRDATGSVPTAPNTNTALPVVSRLTDEPKPDPRVVLDIAPDVELSVELIRRRWTLLTEKLDPTKAAALGAEFAAMAAGKRAKLTAAAEELLKPFGEPLEKPAPPPQADMRHNPDLDDAFGM